VKKYYWISFTYINVGHGGVEDVDSFSPETTTADELEDQPTKDRSQRVRNR
jgi:hypothetical protein